MGNDHTTQPHESDDRAFRFRSGAVVRAGWLAGDLPFLTRSLRFLLRAPADVRTSVPVFQPQPTALSALSARLRQEFDPNTILNPGRMYAVV